MIKSIQAARALAAFLVLVGHLNMLWAKPEYGGHDLFAGWPMVGGFGVDFFFVLSGFIICFAHAKDLGTPARLPRYLWRRFSRVYPIYWVYTLGFMALSLVGVGATPFSLRPLDILSYLTLIHWTSALPPLGVAWTLFYEIAFYILFATLIIDRRLGITVMAIWLAAILANYATPFAAKKTLIGDGSSWMNLAFFAGMAVYWLSQNARIGTRMGLGLLGLGIALLVAGVNMWRAGLIETVPTSRLLLIAAFAILILAGIVLERAGHLHVPDWLNAWGNASYTTYLAHVSIASFYFKVVRAARLDSWISPYIIYALGVLLVSVIAVGLYYALERPLLKWARFPAPQASRPMQM